MSKIIYRSKFYYILVVMLLVKSLCIIENVKAGRTKWIRVHIEIIIQLVNNFFIFVSFHRKLSRYRIFRQFYDSGGNSYIISSGSTCRVANYLLNGLTINIAMIFYRGEVLSRNGIKWRSWHLDNN